MSTAVLDDIIKAHEPAVNRHLEITRREYQARWKKVQRAMHDRGYDLAYACGSELDRSDIAWLAGVFDPIIERYGILIPAQGKPVVVAGSEGGHVIEECVKSSGAEVALLREYQISDEDYRFARFESIEDVVSRLIPVRPGRPVRIAVFSSSQFIPYEHVSLLGGRFGAENIIFDVDLLRKIKYEKSESELKITGLANAIADAAFLGMLTALRPGVRELDVAAAGDYIMKKLGARRTGFPTIVSSGARGRSVLGPATNRMIKKGEFVSMGVSPTFNGYHGIMRRTVKAGESWTKDEEAFLNALEGLYHVVIRAVKEAARKNLPADSIDKKGKRYLENLKIRTIQGRRLTPREPYTFIHNTGCSECQEGFGAVTPYSADPLGKNVALMIDVAFLGFDGRGNRIFPVEYAVIEDCFWKRGREVGVYNRVPLRVQEFVGKPIIQINGKTVNPYQRPF